MKYRVEQMIIHIIRIYVILKCVFCSLQAAGCLFLLFILSERLARVSITIFRQSFTLFFYTYTLIHI